MLNEAKKVLQIEIDCLSVLKDRLDDLFTQLVDLIYKSKGRLVVSGIGKSGIIAQKIVATLNSTGTRSFFLHPVEALHGDIGAVVSGDILLALSYSGETAEILSLMAVMKEMGCEITSFTGNPNSSLAKMSLISIDASVEREACPMNLAPTSSTTAMLALGDALAISLIHQRGFQSSDFKKVHPAGSLGQRLSARVRDLMLTHDLPVVSSGMRISDVVEKINRTNLGIALVVGENAILMGVLTDGDLRRQFCQNHGKEELTVNLLMTTQPKTIDVDAPVYEALQLMETYQITSLPVMSADRLQGLLHLHDILGKGQLQFGPPYPNP